MEVHPINRGYGGNQKTCYRLALAAGADIVIMIHPDYQYTPLLVPAMASVVASGLYPCMLASRILGNGALRGGMPLWKYVANRFLTLFENLLLGAKLSEYHTGYRAFARGLLERLPLEKNSDDFVFDNEILAQVLWLDCPNRGSDLPHRYMPEASSINFRRSVRYGFGCIRTALKFQSAKHAAVDESSAETNPPSVKDPRLVGASAPAPAAFQEKRFLIVLPGLCLLLLGLLIFRDFLFGNDVLLYRDLGSDSLNDYYPCFVHLSDYIRQEGFPSWSFTSGWARIFTT